MKHFGQPLGQASRYLDHQ